VASANPPQGRGLKMGDAQVLSFGEDLGEATKAIRIWKMFSINSF